MSFTKVHINALIVIALLAVVGIATLVIEAVSGVVGCALGEILLIAIGGIVWCAKSFAAQGGAGNGEEH